jgi:hypothetical protein
MRELNSGGSAPPQSWLDKQKIAADAFAYGLVRVVREVSDPRELSAYQADAFEYGRDGYSTQLEAMLAEGWTIDGGPAALDKLGLRLDEDGKLERAPTSLRRASTSATSRRTLRTGSRSSQATTQTSSSRSTTSR